MYILMYNHVYVCVRVWVCLCVCAANAYNKAFLHIYSNINHFNDLLRKFHAFYVPHCVADCACVRVCAVMLYLSKHASVCVCA